MMAGQSPGPLRIGLLGAARIAALAIVDPAHTTGDRLVAVAARDRRRAEAFAARHGVERVLDTYADVVADPEVEVVYNPLANGLHGPWNLAAALATMELIDACYRAAGLQPRPRTPRLHPPGPDRRAVQAHEESP
jgi:NAD(P)-dependent dehydrogenase (short-subunit alcohol dehydrogenase family)